VGADAPVFSPDVQLGAAPTAPLGEWRSTRLGLMKETKEYQSLAPILQQVVDHCVKRYESKNEGIIVGQSKLATRFGVRRETMSRYLSEIVDAGVFTVERRGLKGFRKDGKTGGGRTTNRYRLNEELLSQPTTSDHISPHTTSHSRSTSSEVHTEVLS